MLCLSLNVLLASLAHGHGHVHGFFTNTNSLRILRSTRPWGSFSAQLLMKQSCSQAVKVACSALEFPDSYSILQLRAQGEASMFVCRVRSKEQHEIVSILSTKRCTPLLAAERAIAWHAEAHASRETGCRLVLSPVVFSFE